MLGEFVQVKTAVKKVLRLPGECKSEKAREEIQIPKPSREQALRADIYTITHMTDPPTKLVLNVLRACHVTELQKQLANN